MSTYFLDLHLVKNINVVRLPLRRALECTWLMPKKHYFHLSLYPSITMSFRGAVNYYLADFFR